MFKRLALSGLLLISAFAAFPVSSYAWDRDDWARQERHEYRERDYRQQERRNFREHREWARDHYYRRGFYDRFGYWHRY